MWEFEDIFHMNCVIIEKVTQSLLSMIDPSGYFMKLTRLQLTLRAVKVLFKSFVLDNFLIRYNCHELALNERLSRDFIASSNESSNRSLQR